MEVYQKTQIKIRRIPLPSIQADNKNQKSGSRIKVVPRNSNDSPGQYTEPKDQNSTMSEETIVQDLSDNENRGSCTSIGDLPPTSDSSKTSLMPITLKQTSKTKGLEKMEQGYKIPARRLKSQNGTSGKGYHKQASNVDKVTSELKGLFKEIKLPKVSAKCWAVMNARTGDMLFTKKGVKRREIASLTKMMTCLCVCKLIKQYGIDPKSIYIQVSKYASSMGGTSAELEKNDILSIWDLLHGLMLPSGNDAAVSLAESFGTYIYLKSDKCKEKMKQDPDHANKQVKDPIKYFLYLMNKTAADLELKNTYYANPHGLVNTDSYSTACDQAKLTFQLLKWDMIREIVNKKEYRCEVEQEDQSIRNVCWENTNKLLGRKGWQGVKTGVTSAAGPSLSAYYEDEKDAYIIILLSSATMDIRWLEAMKLVNWSIKHKKDRPILM